MVFLGLELVGKVVVTTPNTNSCFEPEYSCIGRYVSFKNPLQGQIKESNVIISEHYCYICSLTINSDDCHIYVSAVIFSGRGMYTRGVAVS